MSDTSPAADRLQAQIHGRMTGPERLALACAMSESARALSVTRLRRAHPDWTDRELAREIVRYAFLSTDGAAARRHGPLR